MRTLFSFALLIGMISCSNKQSGNYRFLSIQALDASKEIPGAVPVQDMVDRLGNYSASIAISSLPAGNHFEPKVSMSYSSAYSDDSTMGRGWAIAGSSIVVRCPSTQSIDGEFHSPDFSSKDRFCLNGDRLILIKGAYGNDQSEYRTAIDSNSKIVFTKNSNNGFGSFIVKNRSGETLSFGASTETRDESLTGNAYAWYLESIVDVNGNEIKYSYDKRTQTKALLRKIEYGGNIVNAVSHFREINFDYSLDSNTKQTSQYGTVFQEGRYLSLVSVKTRGKTAWSYMLSYDSSGTQRLLTSVKKCFSDNSCYRESSFKYQSNSNLPKETPTLTSASFGYQSPNFFTGQNSFRILIDLNGDGLPDQLAINANGIYAGMGSANGFNAVSKVGDDAILKKINIKIDTVQITDVNRDGIPDLVILQTTGASPGVWVALGDGKSFSTFASWISFPSGFWKNAVHFRTILDFDGDGFPDLIGIHDKGVYVYRNLGDRFEPASTAKIEEFGALQKWSFIDHPRFILDINGDGFPDIVGFHEKDVLVSMGNGTTFGKPEVWSNEFGRNQYSSESPRYLVDINNDGLPDVVAFALDGIRVGLNNGQSFVPSTIWLSDFGYNQGWTSSTQLRLCYDVNGDGIADFVGITPQIAKIVLGIKGPISSQGLVKSYTVPLNNIQGWGRNLDPNQLVDLSGNGILGIAIVLQGGVWSIDWVTSPPVMTAVKDGLGNETKISYGNAHDTSIYKQTTRFNYPKSLISTGLFLVKTLERKSPGYSSRTTIYSYENAGYNRAGFGFVGFSRITEEDISLNMTKTRDFFQSSTGDIKDGSLSFEKTMIRKGGEVVVLNSIENTWMVKNNYGGSFPAQIYLNRSNEKKFDLDGSLISSVLSDQAYDAIGNLTFQKVTTSDTKSSFSVTTENFFKSENLSSWILGRISSAKVTHERTGIDPITKFSEFYYDSSGNLSKEIQAPGTEQQIVKTYGRIKNKFGLVDTVLTEWKPSQSGGTDSNQLDESILFDNDGFPESSKNSLLHETRFKYHPVFGKVTDTIDPNNLTASIQYDPDGEINSTTSKEGVLKTFLRTFCDSSCPSIAQFSVSEASSKDGTLVTYFDSNGQVVRMEKARWDNKKSVIDKEYNAIGQLVRESKPYFQGEDKKFYTSYEYDEIQRQKKIVYPDNTFESISRNGLIELALGRNGKTTRRTRNAINEVTKFDNEISQSLTYEFYADGKLKNIRDAQGNVSDFRYDILGRLVYSRTPDAGEVNTIYNGLNLPFITTDSLGGSVTVTYDQLGRPKTRTEAGKPSEVWQYDQKKFGLPDSYSAAETNDAYVYDSQSRLSTLVRKIKGRSYTVTKEYDGQSRLKSLLYPSGLKVNYVYGSDGTMTSIQDDSTKKRYWDLKETTPENLLKSELLGNGLIQNWNWNLKTGNLDDIVASNSSSIAQNTHYNYKVWGLLDSEEDRLGSLTTSYEHDDLNRLKFVKRNQTETYAIDYDEIGNIKSKTGVGTYLYGIQCDGFAAPGPHAPSKIGAINYCYNAKGQMVAGAGKKISYNFVGQPLSIASPLGTQDFIYGSDLGMIYQKKVADGKSSETFYFSGIFEESFEGGESVQKNFVGGNLILSIKNSSIEEIYTLKNRLGSISAATDKFGSVVERMYYSPWGERVDFEGKVTAISPTKTNHGFTGLEHLDTFGLIHANGRLYDPKTSVFLSPDPVAQDIYDLQSLNKYSYAANSPLMIVDPSGFSGFSVEGAFKSAGRALGDPLGFLGRQGAKLSRWISQPANQRQLLGAAVAIASIWLAGPVLGLQGFQYMAFCAAGNAVGSYIASGGDINAAGIGAVQGFAFAGINLAFSQYTGPLATELRTLSQASAGGAIAAMAGGSFEKGFISTGITSAFTNFGIAKDLGVDLAKKGLGDVAYNASVMAVVGGSASELTGGTFENGAISSAYTSMFGQAFALESGQRLLELLADLVGKIWNLPNTILGLAYGGLGYVVGEIGHALGRYPFDPEIGFGHNGIEFTDNPFVLPRSAVTLGNAIIYGSGITPSKFGAYGDPTVEIGAHEQAHTYQSQVLGLFFLPVYFMSGGISGPNNNQFENAAQNYGRGGSKWWPW